MGKAFQGEMRNQKRTRKVFRPAVVRQPSEVRPKTRAMQLAEEIDAQMAPTTTAKEDYRNLKRKLKMDLFVNEFYKEKLLQLEKKFLKLVRDNSFLKERLMQYQELHPSDSSDEDSNDSPGAKNEDGIQRYNYDINSILSNPFLSSAGGWIPMETSSDSSTEGETFNDHLEYNSMMLFAPGTISQSDLDAILPSTSAAVNESVEYNPDR